MEARGLFQTAGAVRKLSWGSIPEAAALLAGILAAMVPALALPL